MAHRVNGIDVRSASNRINGRDVCTAMRVGMSAVSADLRDRRASFFWMRQSQPLPATHGYFRIEATAVMRGREPNGLCGPDPDAPTSDPASPLIEVDLPCRRSEWHGSF